jgi:hypothetical protein
MHIDFFAAATHPDERLLDRYEAHELDAGAARAVCNHLLWCSSCRSTLNLRRMLINLMDRNR